MNFLYVLFLPLLLPAYSDLGVRALLSLIKVVYVSCRLVVFVGIDVYPLYSQTIKNKLIPSLLFFVRGHLHSSTILI